MMNKLISALLLTAGSTRQKLLLLLLSLSLAPTASALTLGEPQVHSHLGQPLRVSIMITQFGDLDAENLQVGSAASSYYEQLGTLESLVARSFEYQVEKLNDKQYRLTIRSAKPINEPYLNFLVRLRWPDGELLREVSLLMDAP